MPPLLLQAHEAIDAANAEDPSREIIDGKEIPHELLYGQRMTAWLAKLRSDAPEALQIAVRAQHIRRWVVPRSSYPMDRKGYLMWRRELATFHAKETSSIMRGLGYDDELIERVRFLIQKRQLNKDEDSQTLEDCACLVFLEFHADEFEQRTDEDKMIEILRKTWGKMSERGHAAALAMPHSPRMLSLIQRALAD